MRLRLSLSVDSRRNLLPLNYHYLVSSWIYKTIHAGDSDFSAWLHRQGYTRENRRFKLFTFGDIYNHKPWHRRGDRIAIDSGCSELVISFWVEAAVEHFVIGLFRNLQISITDGRSEARFTVQTVERLPEPAFAPKMEFRTLSPVCLSRDVAGRKHAEYLHPRDPQYPEYFFNNLLHKYLAVTGEDLSLEALKSQMQRRQPFSLQIRNEPVSRLSTIKSGTPQQTAVKGYHFRFRISAPPELLALGYHAGVGEKNAMGFGCVGKKLNV